MSTDLPITRYSPESCLRHPLRLLADMWRDLRASRELGWRLFVRDLSAQYRQTALGYFWAVFPPLVTTAVMILLHASSLISASDVGIPYPAFVMLGTVFFQVFVDSLNAPLKVITESKAILTKINLPREAFILSGIGDVLFSFLIKLAMLILTLAWFRVHVSWTAPLALLPLLGMLMLGTTLGVLLIPLGLLFKDIQSALLIFATGLVWVTPVAYTSTASGKLGAIMRLNPLTPLLQAAKNLVLGRMVVDVGVVALVFGLTLVMLFIGWVIYRLALPIVIERIGM